MKRIFGFSILCASLAALCGVAQAEVRKDSPDRFSDAVDLSRFRKGNTEWDTQELIASGLTALHEENVRVLKKLDQIESRLDRLEGGSKSSAGGSHGS